MVSDEAMKVWRDANRVCENETYRSCPPSPLLANQAAAAVIEAALTRARNEGIEAAAGVAKTAWIEADYNLVGIADADVAMRLCEYTEASIRNLKDKGHE